MKRGTTVLAMLSAAVAGANFCARDDVPAATLLFPYIEVALDASDVPDPRGKTTITRITNTALATVIVHLTVWDVAGVPRIDFDEILSGYDVLQINWRDFLNGRFDLFDTGRAPLPEGYDSYSRAPFQWGPDRRCMEKTAGCADPLSMPQNRDVVSSLQCPTVPPFGNRMDLADNFRNLLRGSTIAREGVNCPNVLLRRRDTFPETLSEDTLFFYVTADVVGACAIAQEHGLPDDPQYWTLFARTDNVLIGELIYLSPDGNKSEMMPAAHIEAATGAAGGPSVIGFYEERSGGAETNREPLATAFAFSYGDEAWAGISSSLIFWKNFTELTTIDDLANDVFGSPSNCGSYVYYAWDMDERSLAEGFVINGVYNGGGDVNQFPFATQRVPLSRALFDLPASYGWMLLVLPPSYAANHVDTTPDGQGWLDRPYMGWAALQFDFGTYSAGSDAITLANALCFPDQILPTLGTNTGTTPIR